MSGEQAQQPPDSQSASNEIETGADSVVRALENAGAEHLFGIQGGAIMPVYDALYDSKMHHVTMAHEQGAVHAADAYGIVSGDPGVCMATSGPGATNLVTGIADANMDSDPVVALTGQVPTDVVGNDAFQETDTVGITSPITKENTFADDPDSVGTDVGRAFALAKHGRQGPTLVDLPKNVTKGETETDPGEPTLPETYEPPETADPEAVSEAAAALRGQRGDSVARERARDSGRHDDAGNRILPRGPRTLARNRRHARHRLRQHGDHGDRLSARGRDPV